MKQMTLANNDFEQYRKPTRRDRLLAEMNTVVPWADVVAVIEPYYPKTSSAGGPDFVDEGLGGSLANRPEWAAYAPGERGKMRVPTLRNVDLRPFDGAVKAYMHNGVFKSLEEVVRFVNTRDVLPVCASTALRSDWGEFCWPAPEVAENVNTSELGNLGLTREEEADLVAFLKTLSDGYLPDPSGKR